MPIAAEYNDVDSRLLRKAADSGLDAFICDANEVIDLKLVRESKDVDDDETTFNPEMSHQIYGENETIFGYKDLKIKVGEEICRQQVVRRMSGVVDGVLRCSCAQKYP